MARRAQTQPRPSEAPHAARLKRLRAAMSTGRAAVDHLLVTDPTDVGYLTGFLGGDSFLLVTPGGKPCILSDRRYEEDLEPFKRSFRVVMRDRSHDARLADLLGPARASGGLERLGVQSEHMTIARLGSLRAALRGVSIPARSVVPTRGLVAGLRAIKDPSEVAVIRRAIACQQAAFEAVRPQIKPGMTELGVAALLEMEMKSGGSTAPAFGTTVAAGANSSRPHHATGAAKVRARGPLLIDFGATIAGYRSDMTRVLHAGPWTARAREIYSIVLEAHRAGAAALKPGVRCVDVDRAARAVIERAGFGPAFAHSLGHGLGMNVHEAPLLAARAAPGDLIEPGQVVTIEPGIYLPGELGVRLEDDYLITARGATNLCSLPMDPEAFVM